MKNICSANKLIDILNAQNIQAVLVKHQQIDEDDIKTCDNILVSIPDQDDPSKVLDMGDAMHNFHVSLINDQLAYISLADAFDSDNTFGFQIRDLTRLHALEKALDLITGIYMD